MKLDDEKMSREKEEQGEQEEFAYLSYYCVLHLQNYEAMEYIQYP